MMKTRSFIPIGWVISLIAFKHPIHFTGKLMKKFFPSHLTRRIAAQSGVFTIHHNPSVPIDSNRMVRLIIPKFLKPKFSSMIFRYGITHATLFPDIDGAARFLEWNLRSHLVRSRFSHNSL